MPAIGPDSLVLVTGASGYLAAHTVHQLLERGHRVRGTVRSTEKGEYLKQLFKRHGDKFHYVIAEDLEKPDVFDDAVKDVDGVLHTASPFHFDAEGKALDNLVNPAVRGTKSVLASIAKGKSVKRVVITSSFAAIIDSSRKPPVTFTEADWNEKDPRESAEQGNDQKPIANAYRASKSLAEKAAWEFVEANQPGFDVVAINPPLVLGPPIHQVNSADSLNTSVKQVWNLLHGQAAAPSAAIDVRDAAKAHVEALLRGDAGGQRFAPSIGMFNWKQVADIVTETKIDIPASWRNAVPKDVDGTNTGFDLSGEKAHRELGIHYHSLKESIEGTLQSLMDYEKRGWKGVPSEEIVYLP